MIGLYHAGTSVVHRAPAGVKLLGMLLAIIGIVAAQTPWQLGIAALAVAVGFAVAAIPVRLIVAQLWPLRWIVAVTAVFQVIFAGPERALMVCGGLVLAVAVAALVTLTTRVTEMLDVAHRLLRPLRRWGVDPDRVGLVLSLTIRCVPLLVAIVRDVADARKARGQGFSIRALAGPTIVRALRAADGIGDALVARGVDD